MTLEKSFDETIKKLEAKLTKPDITRCQETARLSSFYTSITYRGAYITALMQKIQLNTIGEIEETEEYDGT